MPTARKRALQAKAAIAVRKSSGTVFEDLGLPDSVEALAKAGIAARISIAIEKRGLTQTKAAQLLKLDQADISNLKRGKLKGFSAERLFRCLSALGQDVEIVIHERRPRRVGSLRVLDKQSRNASSGARAKR